VGACVQGIKPPTFAHPKEPHAQEAGIAVCSPPSNHVMFQDMMVVIVTTIYVDNLPHSYQDSFNFNLLLILIASLISLALNSCSGLVDSFAPFTSGHYID
jgi:hypothetical protein